MRGQREEAGALLPPRANPLLVGHDQAEAELVRWIAARRLGHALLIGGPRGIGKATLAYRIARTLLRQGPTARGGEGQGDAGLFGSATVTSPPATLDVPDSDRVFRWVASASHPDLLTVERRFDEKRGRQLGEIVVDDVRRIATFLNSSAALGGWRVVVVDAADEMNRNAANALLKILEEPNHNSLLLLVSHQASLLPATIRSRCRQTLLRRLGDGEVDMLVGRYRPDIGEADRRVLVALAEGSLGRALRIADAKGIAAWRRIESVLTALAADDPRPALAWAAEAQAEGDGDAIDMTLQLLLWWLRHLVRMLAESPAALPPPVSLPLADTEALRRWVAAGSLDHWLQVWDKTHHLAVQAAGGNLDRKQVLSSVLLDLACEACSTSR